MGCTVAMSSLATKYAEAVKLYAETTRTQKDIAEACGVSLNGFRTYLCTHRRDLLLARHQVNKASKAKLGGKSGQRVMAHEKYKEAIEACDSEEYLKFNISQIARLFGLNGTALANQLRMHYPDIFERREKERHRRGLNDNQHRGARPQAIRQYAEAVEMYRTTDLTIKEIAELCKVSFTGFRQHVQFYHQDIRRKRMEVREKNVRQTRKGKRNGNNGLHVPRVEVAEKYARAVELYRTTDLSVEEISRREGLALPGLRFHLRVWHSDLMMERRGVNAEREENPYEKLGSTKRYSKAAGSKYAEAIRCLKECDRSVCSVAKEYGFHPEVFRAYLREHEPELIAERGMMQAANGKRVKKSSAEKYAEAIRLLEEGHDSLKEICRKLGLVYNSVGGFVRRNYPELLKK